ncbi:2' O-ribose methyltransferase [Microbotryomycetes sp. JL221]|nr:2' O-ribose methyltransferase [Microbotryomycetes sp. JL221]
MGQTQSGPTPLLAGFELDSANARTTTKQRGPAESPKRRHRTRRTCQKASRLTSPARGSWPPHRQDSLVHRHTEEELLRERFMAEEKLSGRPTKDGTPSPLSTVARSPVWGKQDSESSPELEGLGVRVGGQKLGRMQVKRTASGKPDLLSQRAPTQVPSIPPLFVTVQEGGEGSTYQPLVTSSVTDADRALLAVPTTRNQSLTSSPKSHWSESSVGCPTPPEPMHSFRDSLNLAMINPKRLSSNSAHRLSTILGGSTDAKDERSTSPASRVASKRKAKGLKKRGPIVVVSAERVGSGRYSMMKAAAARSAETRRSGSEGVNLVVLESDLPLEEDIIVGDDHHGTLSSSREATTSQIPFPTASTSTSSAASVEPPRSPKRPSSAEELLTYIAASPDLTCADPNVALFETQATPKKSIVRLPEGHPGNHHARFRQSRPQAGPAVNGVQQPEVESVSSRRSSNQSRRSSGSSTAVRRKLSTIRLSICEQDSADDVKIDEPENRRGSSASWATVRSKGYIADTLNSTILAAPRRKSSSSSLRRASTVAGYGTRAGSQGVLPFVTGPVVPPRPRQSSSSSRLSFPQSVALTSETADTPKRDPRRGSGASSSYFVAQDMPTTPEALPSPPPLPTMPAAGEINWAAYSLTSRVSPVTSPGASTESRSSYIAPETVDAFPMPPNTTTATRLQAIAPTPSTLDGDIRPASSSSRPGSFPSDASTPSSANSSIDTATSTTLSEGLLQRQQLNTSTLHSLRPAHIESKNNSEPLSPALSISGEGPSSGTATVCDLTRQMHDTPPSLTEYRFPEPAAIVTSSPMTSRLPSQARFESPMPHLWSTSQPLPQKSANVRDSGVLHFADFKFEFMTPKTSAVARQRRQDPTVSQAMLDCISPTQDVLDALEFEDDEELEAARHRFRHNDLLDSTSPVVDDFGVDVEVCENLIEAGGHAGRQLSTTSLPSPPPLITVPSFRRDTHPTWVPPSMRRGDQGFRLESFHGLEHDKGSQQGWRLGASDKRGFDKAETIPAITTRSASNKTSAWVRRQAKDHFVKQRSAAHVLRDRTGSSSGSDNSNLSSSGRDSSNTNIGEQDAPQAFVARSAFKLIELDDKYGLIKRLCQRRQQGSDPIVIVDLGAAPGGWIQAASMLTQRHMNIQHHTKRLSLPDGNSKRRRKVKIVGVDLLSLDPTVVSINSTDTDITVKFVQGNFLDSSVQNEVVKTVMSSGNSKYRIESGDSNAQMQSRRVVDLVMSDMMMNMSGNYTRDAQLSFDLCVSALEFALATLKRAKRPDSNNSDRSNTRQDDVLDTPQLVMKHFQSDLTNELKSKLADHCKSVTWFKPSSSRAESKEGYFVCAGLHNAVLTRPGDGFVSTSAAKDDDDLYF